MENRTSYVVVYWSGDEGNAAKVKEVNSLEDDETIQICQSATYWEIYEKGGRFIAKKKV
jgi:hypothetical protein